jgi:hypothetical protein
MTLRLEHRLPDAQSEADHRLEEEAVVRAKQLGQRLARVPAVPIPSQ